ncbi:MAG: CCA tRNA nucleotidyltransferase [Chloroflexota bacterium]
MSRVINLAGRIKERLPAELVGFMQEAGDVAAHEGQGLYLVGGVVRDLLLGRTNLDLDLVVEGDAIALTEKLNDRRQGKITTHRRFRTAKIKWDRWSADLASARSETYARPGALPIVKPDSINRDLFRRDFTVNAMAIDLNPDRYGDLIDLHGGRTDLEQGIIRVLHERSFVDDATRIWRALRYEQRLGFRLEHTTLGLLKRDVPMLKTVSGERTRYELECILGEELPEKVLRRAGELGALAALNPALKADDWLVDVFARARKLSSPEPAPPGLYLSLLAYRLTVEEGEQLVSSLRLSRVWARAVRDAIGLKTEVPSLADPELTPANLYYRLQGYSVLAVTANRLAADSPVTRRRIELFLDKLRYIKPSLDGQDLRKMGVAPGPRIKELLGRLNEARLDGRVTDRRGEVALVEDLLADKG